MSQHFDTYYIFILKTYGICFYVKLYNQNICCLFWNSNWPAFHILFGNHTSELKMWLNVLMRLNLPGRKPSCFLPLLQFVHWVHHPRTWWVPATKPAHREVQDQTAGLRELRESKLDWPESWWPDGEGGWRSLRPSFGPGLHVHSLTMNTVPCSVIATLCREPHTPSC